jgi:O-antigen/teichoic acid export membrane protein
MIPFFLKKLGTSGYGTWAVFLAISGMTSLADLGLVTALSKHVAEFYALNDSRALSRLINTGFILYLVIACLLAGTLWISSPLLLPTLFRGALLPARELRILWNLLILLVFANALTLLFASVAIGLQRMDLTTGISSLNLMSAAGLSVVFLSLNWGLRGVLFAYVLTAWITLLAYVLLLRRLLPGIKTDVAACRWATAREILGFSVKTYITQVAVVIHNQIEKIYLARFLGVVSVGWYDISSDLALKVRGIPSLVLAPIMPAASELHALRDQSRIAHLYYRSHKYLAFIGVPIVAYSVFISKRFLELWVGSSLSFLAVPLSLLLIVNLINLTTGPGYLILMGSGKLRPGLYSALLGIVLNLLLSLFLIRSYGFGGAIIGTSLSLGISSSYFLLMFKRETLNTFPKVVRKAYLTPVICSLAILTSLGMFTQTERSSWTKLTGNGVMFGVAYLVVLLLFRFFDTFDLAIVERFVPVPNIARRIIPNAELGCTLLPDPQSARTRSR